MVYLAPVPTPCRVFKTKSTEGFHTFPYVVALFSAMLWIYYAILRSNILLITINSTGCFIEGLYIAVFIAFAPKKARILTLNLLILLNFAGFGIIIIFNYLLAKGSKRTRVLGWLRISLSAIVYIAPFSIVRQVIHTKSVEFMLFWLSFSLILSAVTWFFYGLLLKDLYIAVPNIVGFTFGVLQIVLYFIYKKSKEDLKEKNLPTINESSTISTSDQIHPICSLPIPDDPEVKDQNVQDHVKPGEKKADGSCIQV